MGGGEEGKGGGEGKGREGGGGSKNKLSLFFSTDNFEWLWYNL